MNKVEVGDLIGSKKGHNSIKTGLTPHTYVILKPLCTPRAKQDGEASAPWTFDPKRFCSHDAFQIDDIGPARAPAYTVSQRRAKSRAVMMNTTVSAASTSSCGHNSQVAASRQKTFW